MIWLQDKLPFIDKSGIFFFVFLFEDRPIIFNKLNKFSLLFSQPGTFVFSSVYFASF
jgi:hypothetical protein